MDTSNVKYKIKKYTSKLKHSKNLKEAESYQDKLRYYHTMNQKGGADGPQSLVILHQSLEQQKNDIINQLSQVQTLDLPSLNKLQENIQKAKNLIEEYKTAASNNAQIAEEYKNFATNLSESIKKTPKNVNVEGFNKKLNDIILLSDSMVTGTAISTKPIESFQTTETQQTFKPGESTSEQEINQSLDKIKNSTNNADILTEIDKLNKMTIPHGYIVNKDKIKAAAESIKYSKILTEGQKSNILDKLEKIFGVNFTS